MTPRQSKFILYEERVGLFLCEKRGPFLGEETRIMSAFRKNKCPQTVVCLLHTAAFSIKAPRARRC